MASSDQVSALASSASTGTIGAVEPERPSVPPLPNGRDGLSAAAEEALRALKSRPSASIRARLGTSFALWFLVSLGITITSIVLMSGIKDKLHFLEVATVYLYEIQQARRFEKNYFLYGTGLKDATEHVQRAKSILEGNRPDLEAVVGSAKIDEMLAHLGRYEKLIEMLGPPGKVPTPERKGNEAINSTLREHGGMTLRLAEELVHKERRSVNAMLTISQQIPIPFLVALVILIAYLSYFISRQMLAPITRMMAATRRIAEGDLTPITPHRKYRDEFTELAMAINHMMYQLVQRHDLLVRAHKLKAVGTLTAGIAHELNNPINNIMLTAATLSEDFYDYTDEERIQMILELENESERARKIVRNLLDFARETDPSIEPLDIRGLMEATLQLARNQIKLSKVKVRVHVVEELPPVYGDAQQLQQVFLNLILNALDAMPSGGKLTISTGTDRSRERVFVEVADTGTGIPTHQLDDIFDPFFTTKRAAKGTGLGLSVSLGVVKKHGGDILVKSQVNTGTVFTVWLPVTKIPADLASHDEEEQEHEHE